MGFRPLFCFKGTWLWKGEQSGTTDERAGRIQQGASLRAGLQPTSAEEEARIKRLMRRAEGRATVNRASCVDRKSEQFSGKIKEMLASQGSEVPKEFSCPRLNP